jgi:flagellar FliL protein
MRIFNTVALVLLLTAGGVHVASAGEDDDKKPQNFVYLKPLMFPIVKQGGIDQFVSVTVTLEFDDATTATKANAIMPRIVDAYLQDLYGAATRDKVVVSGVIDPMALKAELESSNTRILAGMPCHVLLDNIGQRAVHNSAS